MNKNYIKRVPYAEQMRAARSALEPTYSYLVDSDGDGLLDKAVYCDATGRPYRADVIRFKSSLPTLGN